jgi:hypothetical protein
MDARLLVRESRDPLYDTLCFPFALDELFRTNAPLPSDRSTTGTALLRLNPQSPSSKLGGVIVLAWSYSPVAVILTNILQRRS